MFRNKSKNLKKNAILPEYSKYDQGQSEYLLPERFVGITVDCRNARLIELVGQAIDKWASEYHLENIPKNIVYEQALDTLRIMELGTSGMIK